MIPFTDCARKGMTAECVFVQNKAKNFIKGKNIAQSLKMVPIFTSTLIQWHTKKMIFALPYHILRPPFFHVFCFLICLPVVECNYIVQFHTIWNLQSQSVCLWVRTTRARAYNAIQHIHLCNDRAKREMAEWLLFNGN